MSWSKILPFRKLVRPVEADDAVPVETFPRFRREWNRPVSLVRGKVVGFGIPPQTAT